MGSARNGDEFAELFPHLRHQLLAVLVAGYGPDAGYTAAIDVLTYARHHWVTIRHRHDLVLHLYRLGRRLAAGHSVRWDPDPVSAALSSLSIDERVAVVLRRGHGWSFDEITEVTGESVAAVHRHHDHGLVKVAAALRSCDAA
jgi:DNA-directed RNA polymerase specialized sigma24 family protein